MFGAEMGLYPTENLINYCMGDKRNTIHLSIRFNQFEGITHDEITNLVGLPPTVIHTRGEKKSVNSTAIAKYNNWILEAPCDEYTPFEVQMDALLDIIETRMEVFRFLSLKYSFEFCCALFMYGDTQESTPSVHMNARYHRIACELNAEFDLDLYCWCGNE